MYEVKKIDGMWRVLSALTGVVQYSSLKRRNCSDWITENTKEEEAEAL